MDASFVFATDEVIEIELIAQAPRLMNYLHHMPHNKSCCETVCNGREDPLPAKRRSPRRATGYVARPPVVCCQESAYHPIFRRYSIGRRQAMEASTRALTEVRMQPAYSLDYTTPDMYQMAHTAELVTTIIFAVMSGSLLLYAIWLAHRRGTWLPVLMWLGAQITMFLEPVADIMGNAIHSQMGQINLYSVKAHPIPLYVVFAYPPYYGMLAILLFDRFRAQSVPKALWWKIAASTVVGVIVIEQIPLHYGLWHYYGVHTFKIGYMAIDMIAMNLASVMVATLAIYKLTPVLTGWRQLAVLGVVPAFAMAGHAGAGIFAYNMHGLKTETLSQWIVQGSGLLTIGMALLVMWSMLELVYGRSEIRAGRATADRRELITHSCEQNT
jgi:hypothetical protein